MGTNRSQMLQPPVPPSIQPTFQPAAGSAIRCAATPTATLQRHRITATRLHNAAEPVARAVVGDQHGGSARLWLPDVLGCLLLQACIAGGGQLLHLWITASINPEPPCCVRPQER